MSGPFSAARAAALAATRHPSQRAAHQAWLGVSLPEEPRVALALLYRSAAKEWRAFLGREEGGDAEWIRELIQMQELQARDLRSPRWGDAWEIATGGEEPPRYTLLPLPSVALARLDGVALPPGLAAAQAVLQGHGAAPAPHARGRAPLSPDGEEPARMTALVPPSLVIRLKDEARRRGLKGGLSELVREFCEAGLAAT